MLTIIPRAEDVEGQPILRPLPSAQCRSVGPFVFFDHMLETTYAPGTGMDIRQHPHIGLSTLTYLFEGEIRHKDSLGSDQHVLPGEVSWMTAGSAIAHIERTPEALHESGSRLHGLQVWLASPKPHEQGDGHYSHHPAATLPVSDAMGIRIRMIAGSGFCLTSPVPVLSPTLYAEVHLQNATTLLIPAEHEQRALYVIDGEMLLDGEPVAPRSLVVLDAGDEPTLSAATESHAVLIGGAPLDGPRRMNWNFVASDPALIEQARTKWAMGDWPTVPGECSGLSSRQAGNSPTFAKHPSVGVTLFTKEAAQRHRGRGSAMGCAPTRGAIMTAPVAVRHAGGGALKIASASKPGCYRRASRQNL